MEKNHSEKGFSAFLQRKNIVFSAKRYGIDALGAMALGLFASLLIGTIIKTIGQNIGDSTVDLADAVSVGLQDYLAVRLVEIGDFASSVTGAAMAVAIGHALQAPPLVLFSLVAVGQAANDLGGAGGPLAVLLMAIVAAELGKMVSKETKIDILVTPFVTIVSGTALAFLIAPAVGSAAAAVGEAVIWSTELQPFFMGILVSVLVGLALTLPISSAALCATLGLVGLAGGAAVAGCCAQMVGFAVMSFRENGLGGLAAQGLGTSMLQIPNILKNWKIWIPPTLTSAVTGPLATCVFRMKMNGTPVSAGCGTCGLVGPIGVITGWSNPSEQAAALGEMAIAPGLWDWLGVLLICLVLPALLTWLFALPLRRLGWIRENDLKLDLG